MPTASSKDIGNVLFPVFLKLERLHTVIIGGGMVGTEKVTAILANSPAAKLKVVAPLISSHIQLLAIKHPQIQLLQKPYEANDLKGADLVIAAVNDPILSEQVVIDAREMKILVNAADKPMLCDFYLSSIVNKGHLKIAISTNGKSPTVAKRLKEVIGEMIPEEMESVLDNVQLIREGMHGDFEEKVKKLNAITNVLVDKNREEEKDKPQKKHWQKIATYSVIAFALMLAGHWVFSYVPINNVYQFAVATTQSLDKNFPWMILAGFLAQMVDGALGMGYGVTSASILLSTGINPAAISGSIHTAEMFASGASGYSHYKFGNVNKKLFRVLVIPGVIGAIMGAFLLVYIGEKYTAYIRPVMACYTLFLGIKILMNAFKNSEVKKKFRRFIPLAGAGGFLDSFGGGGWGPIVTTTLITNGRSPRFVIGTVSLTEFFVTLASAFSFFILLGVTHIQVIVALIIGGFLAAPLAAKLAGRLPRKTSFILLGLLVIYWSLNILRKLL
jgi:uncharacterized protein